MATPSEAHVRPPSVDTSPATASGASGDERADGRAATAKRADAAHSRVGLSQTTPHQLAADAYAARRPRASVAAASASSASAPSNASKSSGSPVHHAASRSGASASPKGAAPPSSSAPPTPRPAAETEEPFAPLPPRSDAGATGAPPPASASSGRSPLEASSAEEAAAEGALAPPRRPPEAVAAHAKSAAADSAPATHKRKRRAPSVDAAASGITSPNNGVRSRERGRGMCRTHSFVSEAVSNPGPEPQSCPGPRSDIAKAARAPARGGGVVVRADTWGGYARKV